MQLVVRRISTNALGLRYLSPLYDRFNTTPSYGIHLSRNTHCSLSLESQYIKWVTHKPYATTFHIMAQKGQGRLLQRSCYCKPIESIVFVRWIGCPVATAAPLNTYPLKDLYLLRLDLFSLPVIRDVRLLPRFRISLNQLPLSHHH